MPTYLLYKFIVNKCTVLIKESSKLMIPIDTKIGKMCQTMWQFLRLCTTDHQTELLSPFSFHFNSKK